MQNSRLLLAAIVTPAALGFQLAGSAAVRGRVAQPKLAATAPQMVLSEMHSLDLPSTLMAAAEIRKGLKSPGDELLDEFISLFPIIFVGALFTAFGYQYVKKQVDNFELDLEVPTIENAGQALIYGFWASPLLVFGAVFAKDAGAPIPSPELLLSPVTGTINFAAGMTAKTSMDVWNLVAPVIGLGDAALRY